ncbi:hypothetical protein ACFFX0_08560 [Citricoccus parietis]|uniref:Uncharacterized protein n=1 Tax=Citricoccus parietis TaxID=592307 RepID=A0ABV5FX23_9MICC
MHRPRQTSSGTGLARPVSSIDPPILIPRARTHGTQDQSHGGRPLERRASSCKCAVHATFRGVMAAICSAARSSARSNSYRVWRLSQNCAETPK